MTRSDFLAYIRSSLGRTAEGTVTYRLTLTRKSDADRGTYDRRAASLTDGLEASIQDASSGSFEAIEVSRTAGPYSRTMVEIEEKNQLMADYSARLDAFRDTGGGWLSTLSPADVESKLDDAAESLEALYDDRERTVNTLAYTVSFAPMSPTTVEAITSECNRLSTLNGVERVELETAAPDTDPRTSIGFRTQEDRDK